jgi:hypothetical protein
MEDYSTFIPLHGNPRCGEGTVQTAFTVRNEQRVFVLPDEERNKKEQITILLRIPPDSAELV